MTVEELLAREAIRDTMAKYNMAGDRLKVDDYAACFTEDGVMEAEHANPNFALATFRRRSHSAVRWLHERGTVALTTNSKECGTAP